YLYRHRRCLSDDDAGFVRQPRAARTGCEHHHHRRADGADARRLADYGHPGHPECRLSFGGYPPAGRGAHSGQPGLRRGAGLAGRPWTGGAVMVDTFPMDAAIQFLVAIVATISFGVTFRIPARHYLPCGLTGAVGWLVYIVCLQVFAMSAPLATLVAALPMTACARFFAVRHKAPITLFLLCGIFPLVPGAGIYYTAYYFLRNDRALFVNRGVETLKIAVALA